MQDGLHKTILNHLLGEDKKGKSSSWPFISNVRAILTKYGLDDVIYRDDTDWYSSFTEILDDTYKVDFYEKINTMDSLSVYRNLKLHISKENYLKTEFDFYFQKLKFQARTGCFGLQTDFERWGKSDGTCKHCNTNVKETLHHRLFICSMFTDERNIFYRNVSKLLPEPFFSNFISLNANERLLCLLGETVASTWGHETAYTFDNICKYFLNSVYRPSDFS